MAHTNGLDFHITEIDYRREYESNSAASSAFLESQATAYSNILKVLIQRKSGVVSYNTWGWLIKVDIKKFMFDENNNPKPALNNVAPVSNNISESVYDDPDLTYYVGDVINLLITPR